MKDQSWYHWSIIIAILCCLAILALNFWLPANPGPEYLYTVECLGRYAVPLLLLYIIVSALLRYRKKLARKTHIAVWLALAGIILIGLTFRAPVYEYSLWYLPIVLSIAWALGLTLLGLACFFFGARSGPVVSSLVCVVGSIFLGLGLVEAYLLCSPRYADAVHYDNRSSRHVLAGTAVPGETNLEYGVCGYRTQPMGKPLSTGRRYLRYNKELFDVQYDFDSWGRRATPKPKANPEFDLLVFGCSFTFGHGLETRESWPWKLGELLGPEWKVDNYSYSGYSANQMLCFLEHDLIEKPMAPHRYAIFLGIGDHPRRNESFPRYPHYYLNPDGRAVQGGQAQYVWVYTLPAHLHGSQLGVQMAKLGLGIMDKKYHEEFRKLYLAMIEQSANILYTKYQTQLYVLLWPDLEYMAPELEKRGIPVIMARPMLMQWQDDSANSQYVIAPPYENHPNSRATTELAEGLAKYFGKLAEQKSR